MGRSRAEPGAGAPTLRSFLTDDNHVLYHLWTFVCGLALVVPLCVGVIERYPLHFRFEPSGLGIVSVTTLAGHPGKLELYYYVLALLVLMLVPGIIWLLWLAFSLSLGRALDRDFGTVATRGCWALTLFPLVFPFALVQPEHTFLVLAPTALAVLLLQVFLVLALPQRLDFQLEEVDWLRALDRRCLMAVSSGLTRGFRLTFFVGTAAAWLVYLAGSVTVMALLMMVLPLVFLTGWAAWCRQWVVEEAEEPKRPPTPQRPATGLVGVRLGLALLVGLGASGYLYWLLWRQQPGTLQVMLAAATLLAAGLALRPLAGWLSGRSRWVRTAVAVGVAALMVVALVLVTCQPRSLLATPNLSPDYLREDGSHLAWADDILAGKFQGRDYYCMYGPLLDRGLAAVMKVIGSRAEAAPVFWWLGRAAGSVAAVLLLYELTGSLLFAFLGILVLHVGVGWRTAAALLSLAAFTRFARTRQVRWALVSGLLGGLALGMSHEFGLCALVACALVTPVLTWRHETRRLAGKALGALLVGVVVAMAPLVVRFALAGGLGELVRDLVQHPLYVMMGYGNLKFPNLFPLLAQEQPVWEVVAELLRGGRLVWYFPIVVWVVTLHLVLFRYVMGKATARDLGALAVMTFGVLAFRTVLARSDLFHLHLVLPVATVLFLWHLWLLLQRLAATVRRPKFRVVNALELAALSAAALFLVDAVTLRGARVAVLGERVTEAVAGVRALPTHLAAPSQLERATVPPGAANVVAQVVNYVREHTRPGEPILAVPEMPVLYFLSDRPHSTRFVQMAQLVTNEHRMEARREFRSQRPGLVLFHGGENSTDNILPTQQFSPILNEIIVGYELATKFGPIYVLRRRQDGDTPAPDYVSWKKPDTSPIRSLPTEADVVAGLLPPGRQKSFTIQLDDLAGHGYRRLRLRLGGKEPGTLGVSWRTREPLHTDEKAAAYVVMLPGVHYDRTHDLDLRDYASWQFNHIRELSINFPATYSLSDLTLVELLPLQTGR